MYTPTSTSNPLGWKPWNYSVSKALSFYAAQPFPAPYATGDGNPYSAPFQGAYPPMLGCGQCPQMGDYISDPSSLPTPPQGYQYITGPDGITPQLVPLPPAAPDYTPLLLLAAAGLGAWLLLGKKKSAMPSMMPAGVAA